MDKQPEVAIENMASELLRRSATAGAELASGMHDAADVLLGLLDTSVEVASKTRTKPNDLACFANHFFAGHRLFSGANQN